MIPAQLHALWAILEAVGEFIDYNTEEITSECKEDAFAFYHTEHEGEESLSEADLETAFAFLCNYDCKIICRDFGMSENHIGGDDVVSFVDSTLHAIKEGYEIHTWYGDDTEVLIIGIKSRKTIPVLNEEARRIPDGTLEFIEENGGTVVREGDPLPEAWAKGKAIADQIEDTTTEQDIEDLVNLRPIAFTCSVPVYVDEIEEAIKILNEREINEDLIEDNGLPKLTIEGVLGNQPLLKYLSEAIVEVDNVGVDILDVWNQDGFCDWRDFCEFEED